MDLFAPIPGIPLHKDFQYLAEREDLGPVRDVINSWGVGLLDRRNEKEKFVKEFQTTFNSSFWELYLNKVFKELGMNVDYTKESPDFCVSTPDGYVVNIEAVVADPPVITTQPIDKTHEDHQNSLDDDAFIDDCTIKLLGRLKSKLDLYKGVGGKKHPYSSLEHVKDNPFVIAIAPFNQQFSFSQNNISINQVLFGIDRPRLNSDKNLVVTEKNSVIKPTGTKLELGIFTNDSFKEISAVIFSSTGMLGKAIVESGISSYIRATRYRQIYKYDFYKNEGTDNLGKKHHQLTPTHDVFSIRFIDGNFICGSDMHLCKSEEYRESHVDGLHIYFNPYATIPLEPSFFDNYDITHNFFNPELRECIMEHHDQSLVSRQIIDY
ncbi:hypothetical protein [Pectobacterium versatile]|uniref:hypothetical protein n=1 Tax=Pectobacterium versatile TaxID=2488639 RepID=UPI001CF32F0A|nr:hypothetical protein [Pectobacterium versatile]UCP81446.1 hypothetical protein LGL95_21000 [Pectobacterium versatile]